MFVFSIVKILFVGLLFYRRWHSDTIFFRNNIFSILYWIYTCKIGAKRDVGFADRY